MQAWVSCDSYPEACCRSWNGIRSVLCRELGWGAATERMLTAGTIGANEWPGPISTAQEAMAWSLYNSVTGAPACLFSFLVKVPDVCVHIACRISYFLLFDGW